MTIFQRAGSSASRASISAARPSLGGQLVEDVLDLQLAEAVELGLEDGVGLEVGEAEAVHQLGGGVGLAVAGPDDPDRLVEVVEDDREPFEDVDPPEQVRQLVLSRRVTMSSRKSRKWSSIDFRSSRAGTATSAPAEGSRQVMLTLKLVWSGVFLKR